MQQLGWVRTNKVLTFPRLMAPGKSNPHATPKTVQYQRKLLTRSRCFVACLFDAARNCGPSDWILLPSLVYGRSSRHSLFEVCRASKSVDRWSSWRSRPLGKVGPVYQFRSVWAPDARSPVGAGAHKYAPRSSIHNRSPPSVGRTLSPFRAFPFHQSIRKVSWTGRHSGNETSMATKERVHWSPAENQQRPLT